MSTIDLISSLPVDSEDAGLYAVQYAEGQPGAAGVILQPVVGRRAAMLYLLLDHVIPRLVDMPPGLPDVPEQLSDEAYDTLLEAKTPDDLAPFDDTALKAVLDGYFEVQDESDTGNYVAWYEIDAIDLPANFKLPVTLNCFDDEGTVVDTVSHAMTPAAISDVIDHASQLLLEVDQLADNELDGRTFANLSAELRESLETYDVIGEGRPDDRVAI